MKSFIPNVRFAGTRPDDALAQRFEFLRMRDGMTVKTMAGEVGLSESAYRSIENGSTRMVKDPRTISRAAKRFGVKSVWLYAGNGAMPPPAATSIG